MTGAAGPRWGGLWRWVDTLDFSVRCTKYRMASHESLLLGPCFLRLLLIRPEGSHEGSGAGGHWCLPVLGAPEARALICCPVAPTGLSWQVFLSVPDLPPLWPGQSYSCHFGEYQSPALLTGSGVMCPSPDPSEAPALPRGAGG